LEQKFVRTKVTSEFFNTAGRDIKVGLTAAVLVSQWTWAATLLQSSNVA
jgi:Na+/proline symporter